MCKVGSSERSLALPLHEGLIVATDGEELGVSSTELDTNDVLGVTTERAGEATVSAWVAEEVDETKVVTSGEELTVTGAGNGVDVSAIGALGVDALSLPLELAGLGGPLNAGGVAAAVLILLAVWDGEEEEIYQI